MKSRTEFLGGCAMLLSYTAFICWLFAMTILENNCSFLRFPSLIFALFYLGVYALDVFLVRRDVNLALFVGLQLLLAVCSVMLLINFGVIEPFHKGTVIFMSIFTVCGVLACAYTAGDPVQPKNLIFYFDSMVVLMILMLLFNHATVLFTVTSTLLMCFSAMVLSMLALISTRVVQEKQAVENRTNHSHGRILIVFAVLLILAFTALLVIFASSGAHSLSQAAYSGLKWLLEALTSAVRMLMEKLEAFLLWLIKFLPDFSYDSAEEGLAMETEGGTTSGLQIPLPRYFLYLGAGVLMILLIRFLLSMVRERSGRDTEAAIISTAAKRSGTLFSGLRLLLRDIGAWLRFHADCIRYRNTAPGLLLWCEKHVPKTKHRKTGESGPAFLLRLSQGELNETQQNALIQLSHLTEQSFYSPTPIVVPDEICKTVKSCRF